MSYRPGVKMKAYKYVIIGGGLAGGRAGDGIRQVDGEGSIALVTQEPHVPYERPPLSKGYLRGEEGLDHVYLREEEHYSGKDIDLLTGVRVTGLDPGAWMVTLERRSGVGV